MESDADTPRIPGNIVFMAIPAAMARPIGSFIVDSTIPVPVELGGASLAGLSWEMIVAGMLRLLAYDPDNKDAGYYRRFVLAVKPDIFVELSETGVLKARNGELDVAEEIFKALAGLSPESPEPILNLAILYEDKSDAFERSDKDELAEALRQKAFEAYKRLLSMDKPFPDAYFNAGFFYLKEHSFDKALAMFDEYQSIGEDEAKLAKAGEICQKLRARGDADSMFKEAFDFIRMGKEAEGVEKALRFLEADPTVWNGWFLVGWGRRRLGQWAGGREAFLRAIELGGESVDVLNELAICEMELGLLSEGRGRLELALRKEPDNTKIISNLGIIARRQGRVDEAAGFFRTVLAFEPGDSVAEAQLKELEAGLTP